MCRFEESICGCTLRNGAALVAAYHVFLTLNLVFGCAAVLQPGFLGENSDYKLSGESRGTLHALLGFGLFANFLSIFSLIGIIKRYQSLVLIFLIYLSVWMFLVLFGIIMSVILSQHLFNIFGIALTVLDVYLWLIVYNYWMQLNELED